MAFTAIVVAGEIDWVQQVACLAADPNTLTYRPSGYLWDGAPTGPNHTAVFGVRNLGTTGCGTTAAFPVNVPVAFGDSRPTIRDNAVTAIKSAAAAAGFTVDRVIFYNWLH